MVVKIGNTKVNIEVKGSGIDNKNATMHMLNEIALMYYYSGRWASAHGFEETAERYIEVSMAIHNQLVKKGFYDWK